MPHIHRSVAIVDRSSIGEARRSAVSAGQALGFDENRCSDIGIVATEASNNILLHAQTGEFLICPFEDENSIWLDLTALDSGPGIRDIGHAMEDGFSSIGTAGQGLGAIDRLSDEASLYSVLDKGTAYWSRFSKNKFSSAMSVGIVNIPIRGEKECGDGYLMRLGSSKSLYMVVDGLGHGSGAAEAAQEAIATVSRYSNESLTEIISRSHDALKKTRGAAMSVALVDHERSIVTYSGVGNISSTLVTGSQSRSLVSQNGTLGVVLPRLAQEYTYPIERNTMLVMFSDGLSTKSSPNSYAGILNRHPALIAGVLYRDFSRKRDDATVLISPIGGKSQ